MNTTKIEYSYAAESCGSEDADHYARFYTVRSPNQLRTTQVHLGKKAISAESLLAEADSKVVPINPHLVINPSPYPVGCTVVKACGEHVEIVENAIVVPSDYETFTVLGVRIPQDMEEDDTGTAIYAARVEGFPNQNVARPVIDDQDILDLHLLPHVDTSGISHDHTGIRVDRERLTYPAYFGLLGDETLVTLPRPPQIA